MNKIKELRIELGLTQKAFGEALGGIPIRTIQDWEAKKRTPPEWVYELIKFRVKNDVNIKCKKEESEG